MEGVLLSALGGQGLSRARPPMDLASLDSRALILQVQAIERSTSKGYATGARDYLRFCISHSLPINPTPTTLARYIAYTSRFIASGPRYLSGARHFLSILYPDFDANRAHPLVQATIRGSRKVRADAIRWKLPLRLDHLALFCRAARIVGHYDDLLFVTILSCGFYACHRMGELVQNNDRTLFDCWKVIKRASLSFSHRRAQYHLPYHKADPFYQGTAILLGSHDVACPVQLLLDYVSRRDAVHHGRSPLFLTEQGLHPTRQWFDRKFFAFLDHDLQRLPMLLFPIFKWAGDKLPHEKKLDLLAWTKHAMIGCEVVQEVPTEKVVHVNLGPINSQLRDCNPTEQTRNCTPNMRGSPIAEDQSADNVKMTINLDNLPQLPQRMSRKVLEDGSNIQLPNN